MREYVILVNENDEVTGEMEKQEAHVKGLLHRAFSIFIFNNKKELLIQQRAKAKYHSPLQWTNTCCSHPKKGETCLEAAHRRLQEELGFDCILSEKFHFIYKAKVGGGLTEHEFDRVFVGHYDNDVELNPLEVESIRWITLSDLKKEIAHHPENFTEWFKIIFDKYENYIE
ncbi:MAG: isopentenyl-diphosphate Delta-isomerase [Flavobacteriaceae bacterium]|jgi:isopentenyl-diphosphate delta-isomerase|nr:isopentenyl-diphosphate Delta-isomerase [Flavobacteriaceae bacterium]